MIYIAIYLLSLILAVIMRDPFHLSYNGDEMPFWISLDQSASDFNIWEWSNAGHPSIWPAMWPIWLVWQLGLSAGLQPEVIDGLGQASLWSLSITGFLYLTRRFSLPLRAGLVGGVIYSINVDVVANPALAVQWSRAFMPWMLGLIIQHATAHKPTYSDRGIINLLCWVCINLVFWPVLTVNLPQFLVNVIFVLIAATIVLWYSSKDVLFRFRLLLRYFLLAMIVNLYTAPLIWVNWISPALGQSFMSVLTPTDATTYSWTHGRSSIYNILIFSPHWYWLPEYFGAFYNILESSTSRWIRLSPVLLVTYGLFANRDVKFLLLSVPAMALAFLIKGLHEPLSAASGWLFSTFRLGFLLREPASKLNWFFILIISLLCSVTVFNLRLSTVTRTLSIRSFAKACAGTVGIIAVVYPVVTMLSFQSGRQETSLLPPKTVHVPQYWFDARQFIADNGLSKYVFLILPQRQFYQEPLNWPGYGVDLWAQRFLRVATVQVTTQSYLANGPAEQQIASIFKMLASRDTGQEAGLKEKLDALNVRGAIIRFDITQRGDNGTLVTDKARVDELSVSTETLRRLGFQTVGLFSDVHIMLDSTFPAAAPFNDYSTISPNSLFGFNKLDIESDTFSYFDSKLPFSSGWQLLNICQDQYSLVKAGCMIFSARFATELMNAETGTSLWEIPKDKDSWICVYLPQVYYEALIQIEFLLFIAFIFFGLWKLPTRFHWKRRKYREVSQDQILEQIA